MANKQIKELLNTAEEQGWNIRATKKGFQLLAPNGSDIVLIHGTPSDNRWLRNTIAAMRRADPNFTWKDR